MRRYLISQHPEVEAKILAELDSLGLSTTPNRPRPRDLTYADLGRMPYLQAVIKACHVLLHHTRKPLDG